MVLRCDEERADSLGTGIKRNREEAQRQMGFSKGDGSSHLDVAKRSVERGVLRLEELRLEGLSPEGLRHADRV